MKFTIRQATKKDVPLILSFIKELAEYEHLSDEIAADTKTLRDNLFSKRKTAEVIFACHKGTEIGFALFFHNFSTFLGKPGIYLEDLFVKSGYREKGCGKVMLSYLAKLAIKRKCGRLEWWVLDWNKPAIEFYKNYSTVFDAEWISRKDGMNGTVV